MRLIRKFFGWVLLFLGLVIIFYALYASYQIFTAKESAPEIFSVEPSIEAVSGASGLDELIQQKLKGLVPAEAILGFLNLISWSVFAFILIFGGSKISGLGIKLLK